VGTGRDEGRVSEKNNRLREKARGVWFHPGALRQDVVIPLYDPLRREGGAREEPSGVELRTRALIHHPQT